MLFSFDDVFVNILRRVTSGFSFFFSRGVIAGSATSGHTRLHMCRMRHPRKVMIFDEFRGRGVGFSPRCMTVAIGERLRAVAGAIADRGAGREGH